MLIENTWDRIRGALYSYAVLGVLLVIALIRYYDSLDWDRVRSWLYLGFNVAVLGTSIWGPVIQPRAIFNRRDVLRS